MCPLGRCLQMGPRPDEQAGAVPGGERPVLLQALLDEQVLPTAHEQGRDRAALQGGPALQRSPERVAELRMLEPPLEPDRVVAEQVARSGRDRHPVQRGAQPSFGGDQAQQALEFARAFLVSDQVTPGQGVVQAEDAVVVRGPAEVVRAHVHNGRDQLQRRVHGQRPLDEPEVELAPSVDPPPVEQLCSRSQADVSWPSVISRASARIPRPAERAAAALQQRVVASQSWD